MIFLSILSNACMYIWRTPDWRYNVSGDISCPKLDACYCQCRVHTHIQGLYPSFYVKLLFLIWIVILQGVVPTTIQMNPVISSAFSNAGYAANRYQPPISNQVDHITNFRFLFFIFLVILLGYQAKKIYRCSPYLTSNWFFLPFFVFLVSMLFWQGGVEEWHLYNCVGNFPGAINSVSFQIPSLSFRFIIRQLHRDFERLCYELLFRFIEILIYIYFIFIGHVVCVFWLYIAHVWTTNRIRELLLKKIYFLKKKG